MNYTIIEPTTNDQWEQYYTIRYEVLRKPWNQPLSTTKDDTEGLSQHFLVVDENGNFVAAGRLQFNSTVEAQIRSMAVTKENQGKKIGSLLVNFLEKKAREKGIQKIILDARENAIEFYKANGYEVYEKSYLLFNTIQHYKMSKLL